MAGHEITCSESAEDESAGEDGGASERNGYRKSDRPAARYWRLRFRRARVGITHCPTSSLDLLLRIARAIIQTIAPGTAITFAKKTIKKKTLSAACFPL